MATCTGGLGRTPGIQGLTVVHTFIEGPTKTGQARVVDIDSDTVAALRAYRATRGALSLEIVRNEALVLGTLAGTHRHPERYPAGSSSRSCRHARRWGRTSYRRP